MGVIMKKERSREYLMMKYSMTEESLANDIENLKNWLLEEHYLPEIKHICTDKWLENHLLMVKNNLQKAKVSVELYITARTKCPQIFQGRDVIAFDIKESFEILTLAILPDITPLGHLVAVVRIEDPDYNKFNFEAHMKRSLMVMEYYLKEGIDYSGFHIVFDLCNLKFGHLTKFSLDLMKTMKVIMKAYPVSFSKISLINYPAFIQKAIAIFKPFISQKLLDRITLHKDLKSLHEFIPQSLLPSDYNGDLETQKYWSDVWLQRFSSISSYIHQCDKIRCFKRGTLLIDSEMGTFRKLEID